jgi:hypothetical protein
MVFIAKVGTGTNCVNKRAGYVVREISIGAGMRSLQPSCGMDEDEVTMAEVLGKAGYATAFYGGCVIFIDRRQTLIAVFFLKSRVDDSS